MKFVDLSSSSRIARQVELTNSLRRCRTAHEALVRYCGYLADAYPTRAHVILSTLGLPEGQCRVWRLRDDRGTEHRPLTDPWLSIGEPEPIGPTLTRILADPAARLVQDIDFEPGAGFGDFLHGYTALTAVPLFNERLPLNWSIMLTRDPNHFKVSDLEESVSRAPLIGSLLESLRARDELARAHAQINSELTRMARIQRTLLPDPIPVIPQLQIAASYETFTHVGGDLYDFVPVACPDHGWCFFIADASGHGPAAAVSAAMIQAALHALAPRCPDPADLLHKLNAHLCRKRIEGSFVTAFVGFYQPASRTLTYSSAGHPPPMLRSDPGEPIQLLDQIGGLPLGILPDAAYEHATLTLRPGQTLLLYTDGITDARGPGADNLFGTEGIERALAECTGDAHCVVKHLRDNLATYQQGRRPLDDQTIVAVRAG